MEILCLLLILKRLLTPEVTKTLVIGRHVNRELEKRCEKVVVAYLR